MGDWMRWMFPEWAQWMELRDARQRLSVTEHQARRMRRETRERLDELETAVGAMALYVRSMQRLLVEKGVMTREEVLATMEAVDRQDGTLDGRYDGPMQRP